IRSAVGIVDLRPAGDAGLHTVTHAVVRNFLREIVDEHRTFRARTDEAHIADEHVDDLRDLINAGAAHKAADTGHAAVVALRPARDAVFLGIRPHAAKLIYGEGLTVGADALLAVENRTRAVETDGD